VDDTTLNGALRNVAQQNGLSVSQFRRALEREGHGFDQFRDNLREELTISQMRKRRINSRIQIDDGEVEDYLRRHAAEFYPNVEYRLSHVLLPLEAESAAAQMQQAQQLIESARAQQSSAPLSAAASDPSIRATDLGWRGLANLPTLFTRIAPQLAVGEVSDPIRADNGIHIIKLLETRGQEPMMVEQYLTRHILLQPNDLLSDEQAQAQLKQLRQRIQQGEAFAPLAQAHSQDKGSASQGGMLPWAGPGDMVPAYEQQMRATPVGGLSQPFRSRFGWHLLEVLEKRRHDATDTILRKRAREALFMERVEEETEAWLNQLR
ncbi:MAG: molecular chaperone SurA, partial [Anaerolineae bacterium]|nr:molecular chaperone SurA [Anaerolineae bacterium]